LFDENKALKAGSQQESSRGTWADAKFSELGKEFDSVFGKGDFADLKPDSSEAKARKRIEAHMDYLLQDAKEAGEKLTRVDAFKKALEVQHGDIIEKQKEKAKAEASRKRSAQAINQPRNTNGQFGKVNDYGTDDEAEADAIREIAAMMETS
jgi:hypothetical protein